MSTTMLTGAAIGRAGSIGLKRRLGALFARWRQRRQFHRTCSELQALPDGVLRDIGIKRSEICSVAANLQHGGQRGNRS